MNWQSCSRQPGEPDQNRAKDHQRSAISSRISNRSIVQKSRYITWYQRPNSGMHIGATHVSKQFSRFEQGTAWASLVRCPERASKVRRDPGSFRPNRATRTLDWNSCANDVVGQVASWEMKLKPQSPASRKPARRGLRGLHGPGARQRRVPGDSGRMGRTGAR